MSILQRSIDIIEKRLPELAEHYMEIPLSYYTSAEWAMRERELFLTQPRALIAASEIANPGDYHVRMAMGRSILLTRDDNGKSHAFINACRHRGAEPAGGCGNSRRFACPYHGWTYDLQGRLVAMPLPDRNASLDRAKFGLVELPSEERHGFIWVVLTPNHPIDVAAHLGEVDDQLAALGCAKMKYYNSLVHKPLDANWKCVAEGVVESLHVPYVHRATFFTNPQAAGIDIAIYDRFGPHLRYILPMFGQTDLDRVRGLKDEPGALSSTVAQVWLISPGILLAQEYYGLIYADLEPGPTVGSALFRYGWMSPVETAPPNLPSPEEMALRAAAAIAEDAPVWEGCGRGLTFGGHEFALIGKNEKGVQIFHEALAAQTGFNGLRYV